MLQVKKSNKPIREISAIYLCSDFALDFLDLCNGSWWTSQAKEKVMGEKLPRAHTHKKIVFFP